MFSCTVTKWLRWSDYYFPIFLFFYKGALKTKAKLRQVFLLIYHACMHKKSTRSEQPDIVLAHKACHNLHANLERQIGIYMEANAARRKNLR